MNIDNNSVTQSPTTSQPETNNAVSILRSFTRLARCSVSPIAGAVAYFTAASPSEFLREPSIKQIRQTFSLNSTRVTDIKSAPGRVSKLLKSGYTLYFNCPHGSGKPLQGPLTEILSLPEYVHHPDICQKVLDQAIRYHGDINSINIQSATPGDQGFYINLGDKSLPLLIYLVDLEGMTYKGHCVHGIRLLLKNGADIEKMDCYGNTALSYALMRGPGFSNDGYACRRRQAAELLYHGADITARHYTESQSNQLVSPPSEPAPLYPVFFQANGFSWSQPVYMLAINQMAKKGLSLNGKWTNMYSGGVQQAVSFLEASVLGNKEEAAEALLWYGAEPVLRDEIARLNMRAINESKIPEKIQYYKENPPSLNDLCQRRIFLSLNQLNPASVSQLGLPIRQTRQMLNLILIDPEDMDRYLPGQSREENSHKRRKLSE